MKDYITFVVTIMVLAVAAVMITKNGNTEEVNHHIDAKHNVICYTYKSTMKCFAYVDQGTHLELMDGGLAL